MKNLFAAAALSLTAIAATANTNLVVNGGFEAPVIAAHSWQQFSSITGWSAGARGVEIRNGDVGTAFEGSNFAELDTTGNSFISQSIATTAGAQYTLSFVYSPRPKTGSFNASTNDIQVSWAGTQLTLLGGLNAGTEHVWQRYSFDVVGGAGSSTVLSFIGAGRSDSYGGSLDDISLVSAMTAPVPEPETYALMLAGLAAIVTISRRRRAA